MAKNFGKLARRYSQAFLRAIEAELGREGIPSPAQKVAEDLKTFAELWKSDEQLSQFILNPMFERKERSSALIEVANKFGVGKITADFLRVLFERDRVNALPAIAEFFSELADASANVVQVEVTTVAGLDAEEKQEIEYFIRSRIEEVPDFLWNVDRQLIGGIVVKFGGRVIDGGLEGRLSRLEKNLRAGMR